MPGISLTLLFVFASLTTVLAQVPKPFNLTDKTLVAWVKLAHLNQRGGSVLTIENSDGQFDGIVFGERVAKRWMPGSEFFSRTPSQQEWKAETAGPDEVVQVAIVYEGLSVRLYRNGEMLTTHTVKELARFDEESSIVIGLRHLDAGDRACFEGDVLDARVYEVPLTGNALKGLKIGQFSKPNPVAWWDFSSGMLDHRLGLAKWNRGKLHGQAALRNKALLLPGKNSYFTVHAPALRTRETELWPRWHVSALPSEGMAVPYDANGCIYWKGKYHLMYIYQDPKRPHGGHCWGHLSSTDLVNWTFHPPALLSELSGTDVGIFSGNAFLNREGKPMLCWFGINGGVCVATAEDDDLIRWKKHPRNPIIPMPKKGDKHFGKYTVWDPYLWYEYGQYWCLLGGNTLPNKKDTLYLCTSPDLVTWTPKHPFFEHKDLSWTVEGEDCSCPDFFKIGNKHALLCISHRVGSRVYLGRFDVKQEKFLPEQHIRMNWPGGTFFAPESLLDNKGRRIFWGWVTDPRKMATQRATGSGVQSMPRLMELSRDGTLLIKPVPELEALREKQIELPRMKLDNQLLDVRGTSLELQLEIDFGNSKEVGVKVYVDPSTKEETVIRYMPERKTLSIDVSQSTRRKDLRYSAGPVDVYGNQHHPKTVVEAPLELKPGEPLSLRIFIDGPLLEVFANDRQCMTQQVFPQSQEANRIMVYAKNGPAELVRGQSWAMKAASFVSQKGK
jgi:beta-fructofuranosidase